MKCAFCGTVREVEERENQLPLCNKCNEASLKAKEENKEEEMKEIIEAEEYEVMEMPEEEQAPGIRCEIRAGVMENGELYFNVGGSNADLLTMDGLIDFARRTMKKTWETREAQLAAARAEMAKEQ
jgi:hypothetical protein